MTTEVGASVEVRRDQGERRLGGPRVRAGEGVREQEVRRPPHRADVRRRRQRRPRQCPAHGHLRRRREAVDLHAPPQVEHGEVRHVDEFFQGVREGAEAPRRRGRRQAGAEARTRRTRSRTRRSSASRCTRSTRIEYVAVEDLSATRPFTCKYQSGAAAALTMHSSTVKLYEQRTGHVAFTHVFDAAEQCDESVRSTLRGRQMPPQNSYVSAATIDTWVSKEQAAAAPPSADG